MMLLKTILMTVALVGVSSSASAVDLYVGPAGSDGNTGSVKTPLASLEGARALIASRNLAGREAVTVWVHGGTYHLAKPFHLGPKDSGTAKAPITYRAVPGEEVILKGSLPLESSAWKPWKEGIYRQSLTGTALEGREVNQLFLADKRMIRARFPNWDFENPLRTGKGYLHATNTRSMGMISYAPGALEGRETRWKNPQTGIVHAFHVSNWGNFQFRIKKIAPANHTIHFGEGGWQAQRRYGVGVKHKGQPGSPFYVENIFEELDAPHEWYHDVESDALYFKPPAGVDLAEASVEAAVVSRIIDVEGAEHLHLDGFHLTQTRATFMDAYDDLARGDWAIHRGGAVYFKDSQNCSVRDFHIEQVGGNGIFVDGFNREVHISGCLIEETGDSAVCFVGNPKAVREFQTWEKGVGTIADLEPGPKTKDYPANCSVKNTITRDVGVYGKQTSGVLISMAMDITVDHCSVYRIARAGVTFNDGTWGGHVMSNCDIYDTILDTGEHGPFNAWGRERFWKGKNLKKEWVRLDAMKPVKLHQNRVGNYRSGVSAGNWTIDLDDGSSNFEITRNLMLGSTLKLRDGYFRTVKNNIMVSAVPIGLHCWPADNSEDVFEQNIVVVSGAVEGSGRTSASMVGPAVMPADHGVWGTFNNNVWWNTNAEDFSAGKSASTLAQWKQKQGANDRFADPLFADPVNRNYQVKADSPALKLGFENFPMDQFGHQMTRVMGGSREFAEVCTVAIRPDARGGDVRYTLDGSTPTAKSMLCSGTLTVTKTTTLCASTFDEQGNEVGFSDCVKLTKVEKVTHQSWLASLLAGRLVSPANAAPVHQAPAPVSSPPLKTYELPEVNGQIVRIELPGKRRTLSLAEVEVFENGKNVALKQKATHVNTRRDGVAGRAVDGNVDGEYHNGSVSHTEENIPNPWWEVDLGRAAKIDKIVISNRNSHQDRLSGFTLNVLDSSREVVFSKKNCRQATRITFARLGADKPASMKWEGLELVTISDFPDYIDASGGQFYGVFVVRIDAGSKAAKAGIQNGDTIIEANAMRVENLEDLRRALKASDGALKCKVFRGYKHYTLTLAKTTGGSLAAANDAWMIDSQGDWQANAAVQSNLEFRDGMAIPTEKTATFRSKVKTFKEKRSAASLTISQSPVWENWQPVPNIGPVNLADAPVLLSRGPDNYWIFGRYGGAPRKKGQTAAAPQPVSESQPATLEGFDIQLRTTRFPNQFDAPGGLKKRLGGYHAWQSRDMVNWVHHGPITERFSAWMTTAEFADGKAYFYYDFPNDQDPHLYIDEDLTDGVPGKNMGMAFKDPSHGSDCAVIRDLEGKFHIIAEDWSPINARTHAWDSPLATHAVSPDGFNDFKILAPPVDHRTKPTGKIGTYEHPHWAKEDPENYKTSIAEYEIHEPEQNAYGDWAAISIGGQYYLFCDFDPAAGHRMSVGRFTSSSLNGPFTWCGHVGTGHPDPDVIFAEGRFYLVTQQRSDFASPGPWVETVETRVGVDTDNDGAIDQWAGWQAVKERYDYIPGFSKQVAKTPAKMDLSGLLEGYGFQLEMRITDTTENASRPILDRVILSFEK